MFHLTAHRLEVTLEALTPVELNEHQGASLRGALYGALRERFCAQKQVAGCAACVLVAGCPVATLVSTLDAQAERGRDVPRPYVIEPPRDGRTRLAPGECLTFGLTLFARALQLFPYVVLALQGLEETGLGKPVAANGWRRGKVRLARAAASNPLSGECRAVLEPGEALVQVPDVPVRHAQVLRAAAQMPAGRVAVEFLTPTRLVEGGRLLKRPEFGPLFHRLWQRLSDLEREFGERLTAESQRVGTLTPGPSPTAGERGEGASETHHPDSASRPWPAPAAGERGEGADGASETDEGYRLVGLARAVRLVEDGTRWVELESYSTRQRRATPISGFVGRAVYEGDLGPFLPWLVWGQFVHVGKDAVKGNGWYVVREA